MRTKSLLLVPEPAEADFDPYTLEETTITLDDWCHRPADDGNGVEVVRLHQHHDALLVA